MCGLPVFLVDCAIAIATFTVYTRVASAQVFESAHTSLFYQANVFQARHHTEVSCEYHLDKLKDPALVYLLFQDPAPACLIC